MHSRNARGWRGTGAWALPAGIAYLELAFKAATTGGFWPSLPPLLLFSTCAGLALELLCTLPRTSRGRHAARLATLLALGLLFCVEYFVYRQFKLYYDPVTVLSGAGDVASQFASTAASLVLSPEGMGHVLLFLAPAALYGWLGVARGGDGPAPDSTTRVLVGCGSAGAYLAALYLVACLGPLGELYTTRYSFENAVQGFGLLTSLRKEAQATVSGGRASFELDVQQDATPPAQDEPAQDASAREGDAPAANRAPAQKEATAEEPAPGANVLDIDFSALAETADDGTYADLDRYVASLEPSAKNAYTGLFKGYNLVFISAEAFCAEAIRPDTTPTLQRMWDEGIQLTDYYQFDTAGTTGGECANLFGLLATEGGSSVKGTATHYNALTLGTLLDREGYEGWAFHNNTYTYYKRDTTHNNLGYSHGYMGYGSGMEQWVTWQWPQSDLEMLQGTWENLYGELGDKRHPFNVYYMSVSGHSDYGLGENMMAEKNWDTVADLPYSDRVRGYLGANVELDRAMEYLLAQLEERGIANRTVVVISADHFPYGLDQDAPLGQLPYLSELYGYEVGNIFQRDHNRPIIWCGSLARRKEPIVVDDPTMSIDLLPTLCNLFGLEWDSRLLPGRDVLAPGTEGIAFNLNYDWRTSLGTYWAGSGTFEPTEGAEVPEGYVEAHNTEVANKIAYCHGVLTTDYYRHVFGDPEDER